MELFTYPVSFEIWNIYLSKFVKRYVCIFGFIFGNDVPLSNLQHLQGGAKLERARDLFEQALEKCPEKFCKPIFLMYAKLEEEHGLAKRAMDIYDRATQVVEDKDKFEVGAFSIPLSISSYLNASLIDVHNLHSQSHGEFRASCYTSYLRTCPRSAAEQTNSSDVSSVRFPRTKARGNRPCAFNLCARLTVLRPSRGSQVLG